MMRTPELFSLQGKVALITGGSRGIGLYIAEALGEMGAEVFITARKTHELQAAEQHLRALGITVHSVVADISKPQSIAPLVDAVVAQCSTVDILVNNAGTNWIAPAEDYPDAGWQKVMQLCIDAPFQLTREIAKRVMIPRKAGRIINIGSTAGFQGNGSGKPGGGHFIGYHAAKGALISFTRALAVEWGPWNITVNCLCPGFIATPAAGAFQESVKPHAIGMTPLGRFGGSDDIKGVAVFLASEASAFVTGQVITADGGLSAN